MKYLIIFSVVFILSSCDKTEKRLVQDQHVDEAFLDYYIIKEIDGRRLWGLEGCSVYPQRKMLIPLIYDSIAVSDLSKGERLGSYKALKGGLWYAYTGSTLINAPGFTSYESFKGCRHYGCLEWKINTPDGVYGMYSIFEDAYGPYEDIYPGVLGYFFKKNGKWGYMAYDANSKNISELLPAEYECIVEINNSLSYPQKQSYFLVKDTDGRLSVKNRGQTCPASPYNQALLYNKGQPVNNSASILYNWYNRFPNGAEEYRWIQGVVYGKITCQKNVSGKLGVMWD